MNNTINGILSIIDTENPKFVGINFLLNFLKDNYKEEINDGKRVKIPLFQLFRKNIIDAPHLETTFSEWENIEKYGDTMNAIISSFNWTKTPEGYEFWDNINEKFKKQYQDAIKRGMEYDSVVPKILYPARVENNDTKTTLTTYSMASEITMKLLNYLSPLCESIVNNQINLLNKILGENDCIGEFYANLRNKPKRENYEENFKKYINNGDLRSIIYWAFKWETTKEGFAFWSSISDKINSAFTQEFILNETPILNQNVSQTKHGNQIMKVDPITHTTNVMNEKVHPFYKDYDDYDDDDDFVDYFDRNYRCHCFGKWEEDEYDYWDRFRKPSIPKEILSMAINPNFISVEKEATVESK